VHIRFKDLPLKQLLIASNSWKNLGVAQIAGHLGIKSPAVPFFFLSISRRQSIN
jgi:hypothetical protein